MAFAFGWNYGIQFCAIGVHLANHNMSIPNSFLLRRWQILSVCFVFTSVVDVSSRGEQKNQNVLVLERFQPT